MQRFLNSKPTLNVNQFCDPRNEHGEMMLKIVHANYPRRVNNQHMINAMHDQQNFTMMKLAHSEDTMSSGMNPIKQVKPLEPLEALQEAQA